MRGGGKTKYFPLTQKRVQGKKGSNTTRKVMGKEPQHRGQTGPEGEVV